MKKDEYGEVINHSETYQQIVDDLLSNGSCLIGWTDEDGAHFDILFTLKPLTYGTIQRGIRGYSCFFVSIVGRGSFGFDINNEEISPAYCAEKLNIYNNKLAPVVPLTILVNNVKKLLYENAN